MIHLVFWCLAALALWLTTAPAASRGPILQLPRLRPDQAAIARHPATRKIVACGRRWGKTFFAGALALACANRGAAVAWVVPTYKNSRPVWRFILRQVAPLVRSKIVHVSLSDMTVTFPSGGFISIYSADNPDSMRGEAFHLVIGDEAARFAPEVYYDVLLPTLADYGGTIILLSTPRGLNWFYSEWLAGQDPGQADVQSWQRPTSDNPIENIRAAFRAMAARVAAGRYPERTFRQEWLADFIPGEGAVFRKVRAAVWDLHADGSETLRVVRQERAVPGHSYAFGIDWGRVNDNTVIAVLDLDLNAIVALDTFTAMEYELQLNRIKGWYGRFLPEVLIVESNMVGVPMIERMQRPPLEWPVLAFHTSNASKAVLVDRGQLELESGALGLLPEAMDEFVAFESTRLPSGLHKYAAPEGLHDDIVMAVLLALYGREVPEIGEADDELAGVLRGYNG